MASMKNNQKNPLYVVKGKDVVQTNGALDFVLTKLNLAPLIELLKSMLKFLADQVDSYAALQVFKETFDVIMARIELWRRFSFA